MPHSASQIVSNLRLGTKFVFIFVFGIFVLIFLIKMIYYIRDKFENKTVQTISIVAVGSIFIILSGFFIYWIFKKIDQNIKHNEITFQDKRKLIQKHHQHHQEEEKQQYHRQHLINKTNQSLNNKKRPRFNWQSLADNIQNAQFTDVIQSRF